MTDATENSFTKLLGLDEDDIVDTISKWSSDLTTDQHHIRSFILDIHFSYEFKLKQFLYHSLRKELLFSDNAKRDELAKVLQSSIDSLPMGTLLKLLEASVRRSPWSEFESIWQLNKTRNKLAHSSDVSLISYKGRRPFEEKDCLSQIYFDAWAVNKVYPDLFEKVIDEPLTMSRHYFDLSEVYRARFGELPLVDVPKLRPYPEW